MNKDLNQLMEELRMIIADINEMDLKEIKGDADFIEELEMDSMHALEIAAEIENKYDIELPDDAVKDMRNLNQVKEIVLKVLEANG